MVITENKKKLNEHTIVCSLGKLLAIENALQKLKEKGEINILQEEILVTLKKYTTNL